MIWFNWLNLKPIWKYVTFTINRYLAKKLIYGINAHIKCIMSVKSWVLKLINVIEWLFKWFYDFYKICRIMPPLSELARKQNCSDNGIFE